MDIIIRLYFPKIIGSIIVQEIVQKIANDEFFIDLQSYILYPFWHFQLISKLVLTVNVDYTWPQTNTFKHQQ
jgi:hypothetical protein